MEGDWVAEGEMGMMVEEKGDEEGEMGRVVRVVREVWVVRVEEKAVEEEEEGCCKQGHQK